MELEVVLCNQPGVTRDSFDCVMWVKEDETFLLHAYQEIRLSWSPTDNTDVEVLHEERTDRWKVLLWHFFEAKAY